MSATLEDAGKPAARRFRFRMAYLTPWLFAAPALLLYTTFVIYPMLNAAWISLHRWDGLSEMKWIGFRNYGYVFSDKVFWQAMRNTFVYAIGVTIAKNVLALSVALLLNRALKGRSFFRAASFAPVVLSFVVVGILWGLIFDPTFGLLNAFLRAVGLSNLISGWLSNPAIALWSVMAVDVWKWTGYHIVLYLAGLQTISPELIEAARLEGRPWQILVYVILPLLLPVIAFSTLLSLVGAFVSNYDLVTVMTQGGPLHSTEVALTWITSTAFRFNNIGKANAMSMLLFGVVAIFGIIQFSMMQRRRSGR